MRTITAADANRYFSSLLRDVKAGETVLVTSRGEPVAKISPIQTSDLDEKQRQDAWATHVARLRSQPVLNLGRISRDEIYDD